MLPTNRSGSRYMSEAPEQITSGVYRVDAGRYSNAISVLLLEEEDGWALVDTGVGPGSAMRIQEAMAALGARPSELKHIFLTHHDPDHIGGLSAVRWWATEAEVAASEHEARVISGNRSPDPYSNSLSHFIAQRLPHPTMPVDRVLHEGDSVAGFRVIATPGHTLGHASLLRDRDGLLFTADAFGAFLGVGKIRVGVRKFACTDPLGARLSAEKLLREEFTTAIFSHGRPIREGAKQRLSEIVARESY